MNYSVTEAARIVGRSRMTVLRAIASGTLSATRADPAKPWMIDGAELARVFPGSYHVPNHVPNTGLPRSGDASPHLPDHETVKDTLILEQRQTIDDLRRRLDESERERREQAARIVALLTDQRTAPPARRSWWRWGRRA